MSATKLADGQSNLWSKRRASTPVKSRSSSPLTEATLNPRMAPNRGFRAVLAAATRACWCARSEGMCPCPDYSTTYQRRVSKCEHYDATCVEVYG